MIYDPEPSFPFSSLTLVSPTSSGGNYFIRCLAPKQSSFYIQPPKCTIRQGILKAGNKKMYCDLIFKHDDEAFIEFINLLETFLQTKIFENREKWFDSSLELDEIENCFTPSLKIIKSGKMYSLRIHVPSVLGKCTLRIFDENEESILPENILENSSIMCVIEIKGVKCSTKSFQLELEMKQMMILQPVDLFDSCVFKKSKSDTKLEEVKTEKEIFDEQSTDEEDIILNAQEKPLEIKPLEIIPLETKNTKSIEIVDIDKPSEEETFTLKKRNDIYFEMYAEAKKKAKIAHDFAISAYLEAKRIKNTYLLQESDSESKDMEKEEHELKELLF